VVVFLEPIALYHEKDLYEDGDGLWLSDYPAPGSALLPGEVGALGEGNHLLVSYANGFRLSLRAARTLERQHGIRCRVLDVRWINPLPFERIREEAANAKTVTVVDECRTTGGGIAEAVIAHLAENGCRAKLRSVRAADTYVPLGPPARTVLVQEEEIVAAVKEVAS
jgi:2-oxoisovalerate dehydrogenase E1 component